MLSANLSNECIKHIKDHLHISYDRDLIIDPHAGNEHFMEGIRTLSKLNLFYNKSPTHSEVLPLDFLQIDFARYDKTFLSGLWYDDVHVICYPPPELAEQFITSACKFAESVSLVMPKKAQYTFPLNYQRMFTTSLQGTGLTGTELLGKDMTFQIWMKADY